MEVFVKDDNKRPGLLSFVCILTFICSGWGIVDSFLDYASAGFVSEAASEALDKANEQLNSQDYIPGFVSTLLGDISQKLSPGNIRKMSVFEFFANILTLAGAVLMWNLKKTGFWSYVAGTFLLTIAPILLFGAGLIGIAASGFAAFFGVIFIVLYAIHLKHMA